MAVVRPAWRPVVIDPAVFERCERATLVFDLAAIERNFDHVRAAARASAVTVLFALKSFPDPRVREVAARHVDGYDVGSVAELDQISGARLVSIADPTGEAASSVRVPGARIIASCDSVAQVHAAPRHAELAIRVSASITGLDPAIGALLEGSGRRRSRFGLDDPGELRTVMRAATGRRVGLHVHHGPVTATNAARVIETARAVLELVEREPAFLNLGGAWHGLPDLAGTLAAVRAALPPGLELIIEPGRLFSKDAGYATGRVMASRWAGDRVVRVTQLSRICHLRWSQVDLVTLPPRPGQACKVQLVGPTCYEDDTVGEWLVEPDHLAARAVLRHVTGYALAWNASFGGVPAADVVFV